MNRIFCLLVGIDEYYHPSHNLKGCVNDVNEVSTYLKSSFSKENLKIKVLTNNEATKENIISAFNHFSNAKKGDQCIFYFSGHGSICLAPKQLEDFVSDGLLKTMVCHDSRAPGKIDFMNLELAYLIWVATHNKDVQFVVITDCCHSGEITRKKMVHEHIAVNQRWLEKGNEAFSIEELHIGKNISQGNILSPDFKLKRGPHIHLAACKSDEKAIECEVNKTQNGIFTHFLIQTLRLHEGIITYEELLHKTKIKVQQNSKYQTPQFFKLFETDEKKNFLSNIINTGISVGQVYFDEINGWIINNGTLNSAIGKNTSINPKIRELKTNQFYQIDKIDSSYSILSNQESITLDKSLIHDAQIVHSELQKQAIDITNISNIHIKSLLDQFHKCVNPYSFYFTQNDMKSQIILSSQKNNVISIIDQQNEATRYRSHFRFTENNFLALFETLEKMAKWKTLYKLKNEAQFLTNNELTINFFKCISPKDKSGIRELVNIGVKESVCLKYPNKNNLQDLPEFQLQFINNGNKTIWLSVLYLSDDYSITNALMNSYQLNPKKSAWLFQNNDDGDIIKNIKVKLSDDLYTNGLKITDEYLKIIISNSAFDTNYFNQNSASEINNNRKNNAVNNQAKQIEWKAETICLQIIRE